MNCVTVKLMQYQLKKAKKQLSNQECSILKRAYGDMIKSYKTTIIFLKTN